MALVLGIKSGQVLAVGPTRLRVIRASQTTALLRWFHGAELERDMLVTVDAHDWHWLSPVRVDGIDHVVRIRLAAARKPRLCFEAPRTVQIDRDPDDADEWRN